jgi:uncharacterized membrane protein
MKANITLAAAVLLVSLALIPTVGAQTLLQTNWSEACAEISDDHALENVTLEYTLLQSGENMNGYVDIKGTISEVSVYDSVGALQNSVETVDGFSRVTFSFRSTLVTGDKSTVTVGFTKNITVGENDNSYAVGYRWPQTPLTYKIIVKLPEGYSFLSTSENASEIYFSDNILHVKWFKVLENSFSSDVTFKKVYASSDENSEVGLPTSPPESSETSSYVYIIAASVAIVLAATVVIRFHFMRTRHRGATKPEAQAVKPEKSSNGQIDKVMKLLTTSEREVVTRLLKQDNVTQKSLCEKTSIPKATMSRTLQRLQAKEVIKVNGSGASKRVLLTRWAKRLKGE